MAKKTPSFRAGIKSEARLEGLGTGIFSQKPKPEFFHWNTKFVQKPKGGICPDRLPSKP
jgi:hypothetical protein